MTGNPEVNWRNQAITPIEMQTTRYYKVDALKIYGTSFHHVAGIGAVIFATIH